MLSREVCMKCKEYWPVFNKESWVCIHVYDKHMNGQADWDIIQNRHTDGGDVPPYCLKKFEHAIAAGRKQCQS